MIAVEWYHVAASAFDKALATGQDLRMASIRENKARKELRRLLRERP